MSAKIVSSEAGILTFQIEDSLIEKMAIVAEKPREAPVVLFAGQGFRAFPVKYFESQAVVPRAPGSPQRHDPVKTPDPQDALGFRWVLRPSFATAPHDTVSTRGPQR